MAHIKFWFMIMMLIYWADAYILLKSAEALVVASKENGLEVNADTTKYMVITQDQDAGRSHSINIDNCSLQGWKSSNIWEQLNISKFYSVRN